MILNNVSEKMWEASITYNFRYSPKICMEGLRKNTITFSQCSKNLVRDSSKDKDFKLHPSSQLALLAQPIM